MKTFKQLMSEVSQPRAGDEIEFKAKHEFEFFDHPESEEGQHTAVNTVNKKGGKRIADYVDGEDMIVYEEEMTTAQKKKREEIVLSMKKSKKDLKDRYGDDWENVMYATATKMAMESVNPVKNLKSGMVSLNDGTSAKITKQEEEALKNLYSQVNPSNRKKMEETMLQNKKGFGEILNFAKEVYGE